MISILLTLTFVSCSTQGAVSLNENTYLKKIAGTWERYDDASAGDIVRIEQVDPEMSPVGVLLKVSQHSTLFGYKVGDIKWKFVRLYNKNTILIENLNSTITREESTGRIIKTVKSYGPFLAKLNKDGSLSIATLEKGPESRIGNTQIWRMIKEKE